MIKIPRVLVTGGAGYIGSHTAKALYNNGYEPIVLDNLSTGHEWAVKWGPFIKGDIRDRHVLDDVFTKWKPEAVIHFAAFSCVGESMTNPDIYFNNNISGSLNLINAMKDHGINHMVFSSSCAVYGIPEELPLRESHNTNPVSPYGDSKLVAEKLLYWFDKAYGLRSVILRYFNAAGADPEGEIGEQHDPETHLIPLAIGKTMYEDGKIEIFGNDYPTPDGTAIRDYIHVTDLAMAHVLAVEKLKKGMGSNIFNLGIGNGYSVKEVFDCISKVLGKPVPHLFGKRRPGDPPILIADSKKAKDILDWDPVYIELENSIETACHWYDTGREQIRTG